MDKLIVYVDDTQYALYLLQPMLDADARTPTHWVLVGCAPRVTRHVSKWVTRGARESWRSKWAEKTFAGLLPVLSQQGDQVTAQLSLPCLVEQTQLLMQAHGHTKVLDARRPKFGQDLQPISAAQKREPNTMLSMMAAVAGAGLLMATD